MATKQQSEPQRHPTSIRLNDTQLAVVEKIITTYSPPGLRLSVNDAVIVALTFWADNYGKDQSG